MTVEAIFVVTKSILESLHTSSPLTTSKSTRSHAHPFMLIFFLFIPCIKNQLILYRVSLIILAVQFQSNVLGAPTYRSYAATFSVYAEHLPLITLLYVLPVDYYVIVAIRAGLLMIETQCMTCRQQNHYCYQNYHYYNHHYHHQK